MLRILSAKKKRAFMKKTLVLQELYCLSTIIRDGYIQGFTENYVKVKVDYDPGLRNQSIKVKLNDFAEDGIILGEILN